MRSIDKPVLFDENKVVMTEAQIRELICELCRDFYRLGWASGTGGGVSIRDGEAIFMAPSGVPKERLQAGDIFRLNEEGEIVEAGANGLRVSECRPLFMQAYRLREAGAVLHSHAMEAVLATQLFDREFVVSGLEMMKGIEGVDVFEAHRIPIIPNTAREADLAESLGAAIRDYPKAQAVLVRGHGVYVWGRDWVQAKTQAECYHYLFEAVVRLKQWGFKKT